MTECKRCGQCCSYVDGDGIVRRCRFLVRLPSGSTLCRIYKHRLGAIIAIVGNIQYRCVDRASSPVDYPDCPYNTGKPVSERFKNRPV